MAKAKHIGGYEGNLALYFESMLAELLARLGDHAAGVYLIGGLAPRYLFPKGDHAGTADVDLVVALDSLTHPGAYTRFEAVLRELGFGWVRSGNGYVRWHWRRVETATVTVVLDVLCDTGDSSPGFTLREPDGDRLVAFNVHGRISPPKTTLSTSCPQRRKTVCGKPCASLGLRPSLS